MKRFLTSAIICLALPLVVAAQSDDAVIPDIVEQHILPGFEALAEASQTLAKAADTCESDDVAPAYAHAFLAWTRVSHLRFGPSEEDNRAFALAFWPDPRGKTPKALRQLLDAEPKALAPDAFRDGSIAARGFYALDHLLFDADFQTIAAPERRCALLRAITRDIEATATELLTAWQAYAPGLITPGPETPYRTEDEVLQVLYKSASTGLQFTVDLRLGRPLGDFDKPRPKRAEAWRSGLSLALIGAAVEGSGDLALRLSMNDRDLSRRLDYALTRFSESTRALDDPILAGVAAPASRIRVEALVTEVNGIRRMVEQELGPHLGVTAGFNALDGD